MVKDDYFNVWMDWWTGLGFLLRFDSFLSDLFCQPWEKVMWYQVFFLCAATWGRCLNVLVGASQCAMWMVIIESGTYCTLSHSELNCILLWENGSENLEKLVYIVEIQQYYHNQKRLQCTSTNLLNLRNRRYLFQNAIRAYLVMM